MIEYKSKLQAVLLLMFGPLGFLYVSIPATLFWGGSQWFLLNKASAILPGRTISTMMVLTVPAMITNVIHLVDAHNRVVDIKNSIISKVMNL